MGIVGYRGRCGEREIRSWRYRDMRGGCRDRFRDGGN